MTRAEYNRQYYQKNKEKLKKKAMERRRRNSGTKLSLVKTESSNSKIEIPQEESVEEFNPVENFTSKTTKITKDWLNPHVETFKFNPLNFEVETKFETLGLTSESGIEKKVSFQLGWKKGTQKLFGRPENLIRLIFMIGLTSLLYFLQVEFYSKHDVSPQFSWALALASEASMICLMLTKFRSKWMNLVRYSIYGMLFSYLVVSLGYHQYHSSREKLDFEDRIEANTENYSKLEKQLDQAIASLDKATRGRSWDNMKLFGEQVSKLQDKLDSLSTKKSLGLTDSQMYLSSAFLIIFFRVILIAVNSLNAIKLREDLDEG